MFDSGISVKSLVSELKNEVDIAIPIPNASYVSWLTSLEQLLYSEYIQEQKEIEVEAPKDNAVKLSDLKHPDNESVIRFEDIYAVYAGDTQLIKTTLTSGSIFPDSYYKKANDMGVSVTTPEKLKIIYFVRPAIKKIDENVDEVNELDNTGNVMLPVEFIDLAKAKLRGEAYKIANEDALAAKWLNDYNVLLENFKAWLSGKAPEFGM